ncbi:MAG: hypothetical protein LKI88_00015 [Bifidobacterium sp.]|jgi:L-asparagine transporter-like permease|nr:hypothetical protein [Bifidobacterium sp.]MCI1864320.1 hypothetical protein [Bifidobacterium sp.]
MTINKYLKVVLILFQAALVCLVALIMMALYEITTQGFTNWPSLITVRPLILFSLVVGFFVLSAIVVEIPRLFCNLIFTKNNQTTIQALRFLLILFYFSAAYTLLVFFLFWIQTRMMHPTIIAAEFVMLWICVVSILLLTFSIRKIKETSDDH